MIHAEWLQVGSRWTKVFICGRLFPRCSVSDEDRLLVVIPGNPGVSDFYEDFAIKLQSLLTLRTAGGHSTDMSGKSGDPEDCSKVPSWTVWVVSHAGHTVLPPELNHYELKNFAIPVLQDQVEHHSRFFADFVPRAIPLYFVGHSIGSYIVLKLLRENRLKFPSTLAASTVQAPKAFLCTPTIERMAESRNGRNFVWRQRLGIHRVVLWLTWLLSLLECTGILSLLLKVMYGKSVSKSIHNGIRTAITRPVLRNVFAMASNEMQVVRSLDNDLIEEISSNPNVSFLYADRDDWVPPSFYEEMIDMYPNADVTVLDNSSHAFVLNAEHMMGFVDVIIKKIVKV